MESVFLEIISAMHRNSMFLEILSTIFEDMCVKD